MLGSSLLLRLVLLRIEVLIEIDLLFKSLNYKRNQHMQLRDIDRTLFAPFIFIIKYKRLLIFRPQFVAVLKSEPLKGYQVSIVKFRKSGPCS